MVRITILRDGFTCSGHAGFAEEGADIVCAAVTAAVRLCEAVMSAAGVVPDIAIDDENAVITMRSSDVAAASVFTGFAELMKELSLEYPEYLAFEEE